MNESMRLVAEIIMILMECSVTEIERHRQNFIEQERLSPPGKELVNQICDLVIKKKGAAV